MKISFASIIEYSFYLLFFLVPLIWLPFTSELFEFNKIIVVYLATSIIITSWLLKTFYERALTFKRTPLDIPIGLFLLSNILSTIFSIDPHTSIFGYYSRFNGGLLSIVSYTIVFYAFVTFFDKEKMFRTIKVLLLSAFLVSIYGVLQHPNPLFRNSDGTFRGIDQGYWIEASQARSFSTLGHANWLAAFLLMVTPFALFFLLTARKLYEKLYYAVVLIAYFVAFTFTYSRGGTAGFVAMVLVSALGALFIWRREVLEFARKRSLKKLVSWNLSLLFLVILAWALVVYTFNNAFISRGVNIASIAAKTDTQLAAATPETGKLRLIVWGGTIDIFKHYPIFGSGVETFAYSYYQYRPPEQNLTGDAETLYNKAHNEFLNYLATNGAFGLFTYLLIAITFTFLVLRVLWGKSNNQQKFFALLALGSFFGNAVQNFFGFSVVPTYLLFYLIPAFFLIDSQLTKPITTPLDIKNIFFRHTFILASYALGAFLILFTLGSWLADVFYDRGVSTVSTVQSERYLRAATILRPDEPLYKASLGRALANDDVSFSDTESKNRVKQALYYLNLATDTSPKNIDIWKIRLQAIYEISTTYEEYLPQVVTTAEKVASLAPTSADVQYRLANTYIYADDLKKAQETLREVVKMRFVYKEAWERLLSVDKSLGDLAGLEKDQKEFEKYFPPTNGI